MADTLKRIRKIEATIIDPDMTNLQIFQVNKDDALKLALQTFEWYVLSYVHLRHSVDFEIVQKGIEERMMDCQQAIDLLVRWIFIHCPASGNSLPSGVSMVDVGTEAFEKALIHSKTEQLFLCIKPQILTPKIIQDQPDPISIAFNYPNDIVAYYEAVNSLLHSEYNLSKNRLKEISKEYIYRAFNGPTEGRALDLYHNNFCEHLVEIMFDLPNHITLAGYTINQIKAVWSNLIFSALAADFDNIKEMVHPLNFKPGMYIQLPSIVRIELDKWDFSKVDRETTERLLDDLTFTNKKKGKQKFTSLLTEPLIEIDGDKIFSPRFILHSIASRNIVSTINRIYSGEVDNDTTQREAVFSEEINKIISKYPNIIGKNSTSLPQPYPDVDFSLYDITSKTLLALELKWITEPATASEIISKDEDIDKGLNTQLENYEKGIKQDLSNFMNMAFNEPFPVESLHCMVLTRISVGSGYIQNEGMHRVINIRMLKKALFDTSGNLKEAVDRLITGEYYPKEGVHFNRTQASFEVAGVTLSSDGFIFTTPFDLSTPDDRELYIRGIKIDPNVFPPIDKKKGHKKFSTPSKNNNLERKLNRQQRRDLAKKQKATTPKSKRKRKKQ